MNMCIGMSVDMCIDMCVGMCIGMCIDMCIAMIIGMCTGMCMDMRTAIGYRQLCREISQEMSPCTHVSDIPMHMSIHTPFVTHAHRAMLMSPYRFV